MFLEPIVITTYNCFFHNKKLGLQKMRDKGVHPGISDWLIDAVNQNQSSFPY
jgi:hypothetical protein